MPFEDETGENKKEKRNGGREIIFKNWRLGNNKNPGKEMGAGGGAGGFRRLPKTGYNNEMEKLDIAWQDLKGCIQEEADDSRYFF